MSYKHINTRTRFLKVEKSNKFLIFSVLRTLETSRNKIDSSYRIYCDKEIISKTGLDFDGFSYVRINKIDYNKIQSEKNKINITFCNVNSSSDAVHDDFYVDASKFTEFLDSESTKGYFIVSHDHTPTKYHIDESCSQLIKDLKSNNKPLLRQLIKTLLYMKFGYRELSIYPDGKDFYFIKRQDGKFIGNGGIIKHTREKAVLVKKDGQKRYEKMVLSYYGIHTWLGLLDYISLLCSAIEA